MKQETLEGNKLIAEFDSRMRIDETDHNRNSYIPDKGDWYYSKDLKYHLSWDWLMPVVEKIVGLLEKDGGYIETYHEKPWGQEVEIWHTSPLEPLIKVQTREGLLSAYYQAVVQFINWYTHQPK